MKTKSLKYILGIGLITMLSGCSSEENEPNLDPVPEISEVDINLSFASDWTVDMDNTRAVPPGTGGNNDEDKKVDGEEDMAGVDRVRVIAFKKRDNASGSYVYDALNDRVLTVSSETITGSDGKPDGHKHFTARGKLIKTYGYEYRVIAVAYASEKKNLYSTINLSNESTFSMPDGEQNWFSINTASEPTYEEVMGRLNVNDIYLSNSYDKKGWRDFIYGAPEHTAFTSSTQNIKSLSKKVTQVPQLFYGVLKSASGSEIIEYAETNEKGDFVKDLPLSGILYRGVAKLQINLKLSKYTTGTVIKTDHYVKWVALMADEVTTDVDLSSYDGFMSPTKSTSAGDGYTAVNYLNLGDNGEEYEDGDVRKMTTWFLATRTRLALRVKDQSNNIKNFQIVTSDPIYSTGNGTGIISPDVVDGVFYLRRNHRYTIVEIDVDKLINSSKHELK